MAPSLGNTLRAVREQRGLSLMDAAHKTHIPVKRLQYLEDDNFAAFGSLTYARSFIRLYSRFLAVDASALLEKLPQGRLGGPGDYRHLMATPDRWVAKSPGTGEKDSVKISGSPVHTGLAIFLLVLMGAGLWGLHVAQERGLSDKTPATPDLLEMQQQQVQQPYQHLSAHVTPLPAAEQRELRIAPTSPKDIEKLLSKHAGTTRGNGIE